MPILSQFYNDTPYLLYTLLLGGLLVYGLSMRVAKSAALPTAIFGVFLLIARGSAILNNESLNVDEAQVMAQAMTIKVHPVVYHSFDGATAGPIHTYFALLPHALGLPLNYASLHLLTALVQVVCLWLMLRVIATRWSLSLGVAATLPYVGCMLLTTNESFVHYASEQTPMLLLCIMALLMLKTMTNPSAAQFFGIGFLSILIFFCKLQAVPMAFVIVVFALYYAILNHVSYRQWGFVMAGAGICGGLLLAVCLYLHILYEVYLFYFKGNFVHAATAEGTIFGYATAYFGYALHDLPDVQMLLCVLLIGIVVGRNNFLKTIKTIKQNLNDNLILFFSIALLLATLFAIAKSGFVFYHYLNYLFLPVCLLMAYFLQNFNPKQLVPAVVSFSFLIMFVYGLSFFYDSQHKGSFYPFVYRNEPKPISDVAKAVLKYAKAGETLAVWGHGVGYYYETGMIQGTIDNHTIRCFMFSLVNEHRERYMWDMELKQPLVFVDDVTTDSFWMNDPDKHGIAQFSDLAIYIEKHYTLAEKVNGRRIFVRNDRFADRTMVRAVNFQMP